MESDSDAILQDMKGPPGDMPRIPDAKQGRPYSRGWYASIDPKGPPPLMGGPVGTCFNRLFRVEPGTGKLDALGLPPRHAIHEPIHIPAAQAGHEGWLVAIVDHQTGEDSFEHAAWIINAGNIGAGPVAKVKIPARLRAQVHGWWVPATELEQARAQRRMRP
jgi:carotenoid cleavage dioxygenase